MKKKTRGILMIIFLVMIISIGAISAADTNDALLEEVSDTNDALQVEASDANIAMTSIAFEQEDNAPSLASETGRDVEINVSDNSDELSNQKVGDASSNLNEDVLKADSGCYDGKGYKEWINDIKAVGGAPTNTTINATVDCFDVEITVYVNSTVIVNEGKLTLTFNGENVTADVVNGVAVFKFTNLDAKTYAVVATYDGTSNFLSSNATGTAEVKRIASYIKPVYQPFIFKYGHLYKFRLTDKEGNPIAGRTVEFSVHSKVYYVKTNSNGWGQIQITPEMLIRPDKIFSRLIFRGDTQYKPATYAVWFNAMLEPAKFSNVKAVKPSYKVGEKNKQITATLKDSKGKPIAGKKVTLTINGKTFKVATNSKGVVKFILNSMKFTKPGKVPFTVVFEDVDYKCATAKSVLTLVKG